jgi:hypothetical protein
MFTGPYSQNCACRVVVVKNSGPCDTPFVLLGHGNRNLLTQTGAIEGLGPTTAPAALALTLALSLALLQKPAFLLGKGPEVIH